MKKFRTSHTNATFVGKRRCLLYLVLFENVEPEIEWFVRSFDIIRKIEGR
jgi:hypothetical protein